MKNKSYSKKLFISIASFLLVTIPQLSNSQEYLVKDELFNNNRSTTNGATYTIEVLNDGVNKGKVLVAGFFNHYNGIYVPGKIAKLNHDGSLDESFKAPALNNGGIYSIAVQPWDGKIVIGGDFTLTSGGRTYNNIARLLPDGSIDPTFNASGGGTTGGSLSGKVTKILALDPERQLVIGGSFGSYKGTSISGGNGGVIVVNETGGLLRDANVRNGAWTGWGVMINDMALAPDGKIVIGGEFGEVNGIKARRVARLNRDGSFDLSWQNSGYDGVGPGGSVNAIAVQPDGKILIGGNFDSYLDYNNVTNSVERNVARLKVARLNVNGKLDNTFNFDAGANTWLSRGFNASVNNFLLDTEGNIYVGGAFTEYGGVAVSTGRLAKLLPDGKLDARFNAGNFDNQVEGLAFQHWDIDGTYEPESRLLVVGSFSRYDAIANQHNTMRFYFADVPPPTPLAGALSDFKVIRLSSGINKITWKTLQASTTYIIERSTDGRTFQKIATYTSSNSGAYLYHEDAFTSAGKIYYRIGMTSGTSLPPSVNLIEYSNVLSILPSSTFSSNVMILPNEIKLTITSKAALNEHFSIQVLTMSGQQLLAKQFAMDGKVLEQTIPVSQSIKNNLVIVADSKGAVLNKLFIK